MNGLNAILIILTPVAPLLAALGLLFRRPRLFAPRLLPWVAAPGLVCAVVATSETLSMPWMLLGASWGLDSLGRTFLGFTALLWSVASWFAAGYLRDDPRRDSFFGFFLLAMAGNFGLIVARDFVSFYAFFALMSFSAYPLVIHDRESESLRAGRVYLGFVILGEVCLFAAMLLLARAGSFVLPVAIDEASPAVMLLLFVGFGIKVGALPLHGWLPLAHPAAPVPASAVLSGAMIKAGLFGWLRFIPAGALGTASWSTGLIVMGLLAAFYGVGRGVTQANPKRVLAYSSISQMGLMTLGVGIGIRFGAGFETVAAAVGVFAAHHALAKGALFLSVSVSRHPPAWPRKVFLGLLALPALALVGFPLTSGAAAKVALKTMTIAMPEGGIAAAEWALALSSVGTTCLMIRFLTLIWPAGETHAADGSASRAPFHAWATLSVIGLVGFWLWTGAFPWSVKALAPGKLWSALWPIAVGGAIMFFFSRCRSSLMPK